MTREERDALIEDARELMAGEPTALVHPKVVHALFERMDAAERTVKASSSSMTDRVARLLAHRACCGTEHDPANGKLHGLCVVCGVPWPCDYAGEPPAKSKEPDSG